jgi:HEAT repeat protein
MPAESTGFASRVARCEEEVRELIELLASPDGLIRKQARRCLIRHGEEAVDALVEALEDTNSVIRIEAAEALLYIASPGSAKALVAALEDQEFGVRWLAAEALIALRCDGMVPLLKGLILRSDSLWFRQSAHHVLRDHYCERMRSELRPVLEALSGRDAEDTAPVAAGQVLRDQQQATRP